MHKSHVISSVTRFGEFLFYFLKAKANFLDEKFASKIGEFLGYFEKK